MKRVKVLTNKGFTLAEILITLTIVAVLAILTIPTIISNSTERAAVSQLKKVYSTLSQAYTLAVQENGTPDNWGLVADGSNAGAKTMLSYLAPYLSVSKDCTDGSQGCFPPGVNYMWLATSLGGSGVFDTSVAPKLKLADGTLLFGIIQSSNCSLPCGNSLELQNVCGRYWVDINGYKGPNQWGKDFFNFWLTKYGIVPVGSAQDTDYTFAVECKDKNTMRGVGCAAWVLYNENMDYLHCNNLDWTGPTKCP